MTSTPTTKETAEVVASRWVECPVAVLVEFAAAEYWRRTAACTGARSMRMEEEVKAFMLEKLEWGGCF